MYKIHSSPFLNPYKRARRRRKRRKINGKNKRRLNAGLMQGVAAYSIE